MSIKTFWLIFLKILGIWLVIDALDVLPTFVSSLMFFRSEDTSIVMMQIGMALISVAFYLFVLWIFIFKTSWIINVLELDKGFAEERFNSEVKNSTILSIATIVVGGLLLIEALPALCMQIINYFRDIRVFSNSDAAGWIIFHFVRVLIGYWLMTNSKVVINFIEKNK